MIHRLCVSNFYSIREPLDVDLSVSGHAPENPERFAETFQGSSIRVPKVVGLWGPNAAGKSNLLRAVSFVSWFNQHSFQLTPEAALPCHFFNTDEYRKLPMKIGIEFSGPADLENPDNPSQCRYAYQVTLGRDRKENRRPAPATGIAPTSVSESQPTKVLKETLCYWPPHASRRIKIFERSEGELDSVSRAFALRGYEKPLKNILRPNVSLISTLVQLGHKPSIALRGLASQVASNIFLERLELNDMAIAQHYSQNAQQLAALNREIQRLDLGIVEVTTEKDPATPFHRITFIHSGFASPLAAVSESHGTRQFMRIFPFLFNALHTGGVAVIDELDTSIHPLILPEILRWFYDRARNPKNAQIWFTCQNVSLLRELNKEEILLCEKDNFGGTSVFGLSSIKSVRRIDNYMAKYLGGTYGAVPHIG
jgi:uncharacterized protein